MLIITKSVADKKAFIELRGIESCITKKGFRMDQWMFGKEVFECWDQKL